MLKIFCPHLDFGWKILVLLATLITVVFTVFQLDLWLTSNKLPKWSIFRKKKSKKREKSATLFIDPGSFPFPQTDVACDAEFNGM